MTKPNQCCEKNCPDFNGMEILHKELCDCPCHQREECGHTEAEHLENGCVGHYTDTHKPVMQYASPEEKAEFGKNTDIDKLCEVLDDPRSKPVGGSEEEFDEKKGYGTEPTSRIYCEECGETKSETKDISGYCIGHMKEHTKPVGGWEEGEPWISVEGALHDLEAGVIDIEKAMQYIQSYILKHGQEELSQEQERLVGIVEGAIASAVGASEMGITKNKTTIEVLDNLFDTVISKIRE